MLLRFFRDTTYQDQHHSFYLDVDKMECSETLFNRAYSSNKDFINIFCPSTKAVLILEKYLMMCDSDVLSSPIIDDEWFHTSKRLAESPSAFGNEYLPLLTFNKHDFSDLVHLRCVAKTLRYDRLSYLCMMRVNEILTCLSISEARDVLSSSKFKVYGDGRTDQEAEGKRKMIREMVQVQNDSGLRHTVKVTSTFL